MRTARFFWAYLKEVLFAGLCTWLACVCLSPGNVQIFFVDTASEWITVVGGLTAITVALWLAFVNVVTTDFGRYLKFVRTYDRYYDGYIWAMWTTLVSTLILIFAKDKLVPVWVIFFALFYCATVALTMVRNTTALIRFYHEFEERIRMTRAASSELSSPPRTVQKPKKRVKAKQ